MEMTETAKFSVSGEEFIDNLTEENKRLQSSLDYANRDIEDMHNKIIELGNKRESQRNMNYKLRKENKTLRDTNGDLQRWLEQAEDMLKFQQEENKKLKEERDELDRVNHNLNAKLSDLYDVKQILRDIVINVNRLDKLKEVVFKYDAKPED